jgi:hypothetical protein
MDTPAEKALKLRPSSGKDYVGNCPPSSTVTICSFSMQGYKSLKYHLFLFNAGIHVIEEAQAAHAEHVISAKLSSKIYKCWR